jgi:hypothetical protein
MLSPLSRNVKQVGENRIGCRVPAAPRGVVTNLQQTLGKLPG